MTTFSRYILPFHEINSSDGALVGGKGMNLGELSRIKGIQVPDGFCVTTEAYREMLEDTPALQRLLDELALLKPDDRSTIAQLTAQIRTLIEGVVMSSALEQAVVLQLTLLGADSAYAVRSSATAEDLPTASFAGQQESYLNVLGSASILQHVRRCWASLFTERAVFYRMQQGIAHRQVRLAVVIQQMVFPQVAGVLFTADPVTGHRKVTAIDACFGLGEILVSGHVNADHYKVKTGQVIAQTIAAKHLKVLALPTGGTQEERLSIEEQNKPSLNTGQILTLEQIGERIQAHFGSPQDVEWCLTNELFYVVQSRPITTLFPVPESKASQLQVYLSVGHQQMMTDPIKPLGLSFFQLTTLRPMATAAGRLFVDIAPQMATAASRAGLLKMMGQHDPLIHDAIKTLIERGDFGEASIAEEPGATGNRLLQSSLQDAIALENKPTLVTDLMEKTRVSLETLRQNIQQRSGAGLIDFIREDVQRLRQLLFDPESFAVIMAGMNAATWLNEQLFEWLAEKNVADVLSQSLLNNVTSEMGLDLMRVADVIRPYPEVVNYLQQTGDDHFLEHLSSLPGGSESHEALVNYLTKYGMRCAGEIDISRPRWAEKPTQLLPTLLSNIRNFAPAAADQKLEQGRNEAAEKEAELLARLQSLPDGAEKARETKRIIELLRKYAGYREFPKYGIVSHYFIYKQALLREAMVLWQKGLIQEVEDSYYLTLDELQESLRSQLVDQATIQQRKEAYGFYEKLQVPRVMTSEGEIIPGRYHNDHLPAGALAGLAVSSGIVEGRARVILKMEAANLEAGDILVTTFTDPSWTPLFVGIRGLVTEVGGLMTHGAVIAREYGLPAVVGLEQATQRIKDGQRIRVNGTEGYVEILPD